MMETTSCIDASLLRRFKQNRPEAFRVIYQTYHPRVFAFSLKISRSHAEAEEITQQTFIRLWEKRHHVDVTRPLDPYLYKITRHCALNHLKHKAYLAQQQQEMCETRLATTLTAQDDVSYAECERLTHQFIDALPEKRQVIFRMHFEEGYSPMEIATLLGLSLPTVKSQLGKASKTVKTFLLHYATLTAMFLCSSCWIF